MSDIKLNTKRTGWLGEQAVARNLISEHGYDVYFPVVDDKGVDMIVDTGKHLKRVQVKTRKSKKSNTSVEVRLGQYKGSNIDVIAIYFAPKDIIAYVPYNNEEFLEKLEDKSNKLCLHNSIGIGENTDIQICKLGEKIANEKDKLKGSIKSLKDLNELINKLTEREINTICSKYAI